MFFAYYLITCLICGGLSFAIAIAKGRSGHAWFCMGLLFGIFALAYIAFADREPKSGYVRPTSSPYTPMTREHRELLEDLQSKQATPWDQKMADLKGVFKDR